MRCPGCGGRYAMIDVSYGTVCVGCLGYPDRCLCDPKDLARVLEMLGVLVPEKR